MISGHEVKAIKMQLFYLPPTCLLLSSYEAKMFIPTGKLGQYTKEKIACCKIICACCPHTATMQDMLKRLMNLFGELTYTLITLINVMEFSKEDLICYVTIMCQVGTLS